MPQAASRPVAEPLKTPPKLPRGTENGSNYPGPAEKARRFFRPPSEAKRALSVVEKRTGVAPREIPVPGYWTCETTRLLVPQVSQNAPHFAVFNREVVQ